MRLLRNAIGWDQVRTRALLISLPSIVVYLEEQYKVAKSVLNVVWSVSFLDERQKILTYNARTMTVGSKPGRAIWDKKKCINDQTINLPRLRQLDCKSRPAAIPGQRWRKVLHRTSIDNSGEHKSVPKELDIQLWMGPLWFAGYIPQSCMHTKLGTTFCPNQCGRTHQQPIETPPSFKLETSEQYSVWTEANHTHDRAQDIILHRHLFIMNSWPNKLALWASESRGLCRRAVYIVLSVCLVSLLTGFPLALPI